MHSFQNVSLYPMYQTMEDDTLSLSSFTDVILPSSSSSSSLSASPSSSTIEMTPYLDVSPLRSSDYWDQDTLDFVGYADEFSPLSGPPSLFNHLCQWNPKNPFSDGNKQLLYVPLSAIQERPELTQLRIASISSFLIEISVGSTLDKKDHCQNPLAILL